MKTAEVRRPRGRPRDPEIEPRVYSAALTVYSERGWYGFSFEAISKLAGVGQAALYRRWSTKADLLAQAIQSLERPLPAIDTGSSREDLLDVGRHLIRVFRGPSGVVGLRMVLDARTNPELAEQFTAMQNDARAKAIRAVVRRAIRRGDVPATATLELVLQLLIGACLSHMLLTPPVPEDHDSLTNDDELFLQRLVDGLTGA